MCYTYIMHKSAKTSAGFTLLELLITVTIIGVFASYGVPRFAKVSEQSKVDMACTNMESIWTAQRLYKAKTGDFTDKITDLNDFLDDSFIFTINSEASNFSYSMSTPTTTTFEIYAERQNGHSWTGTIMLNSTGTFTGSVSAGERIVFPSNTR